MDERIHMELLAPAGGMEQLRAAVQFGADAVYLAADRFGMRARAANFRLDEIPAAVAFAHDHGVKVHVACNILMPVSYTHLDVYKRQEYRLSLAGGQEKIALFHDDRAPLAEGWFAPLAGAPSSHIIKPQVTDRFPFLALNEFMCMEAARALGLDVPDAAIVPGEHPPFFRCPPLRSRKRGGIRRRHAPDVAAGAPGGLLPSYRPHFGREVRDTKNPSRSGYGRHFGGLCCTTH